MAVVAGADDGGFFVADGDGEAVVEDEEFSEPVCAAFFEAVVDDAAVELVDIFEAAFFEDGGVEFAADASGAVHHDWGFLWVDFFFQLFGVVVEFAEVFAWWEVGAVEVADFPFVVIADVE